MKPRHKAKLDVMGLPIVRYPRGHNLNARQRRDVSRRASRILREFFANTRALDGGGR